MTVVTVVKIVLFWLVFVIAAQAMSLFFYPWDMLPAAIVLGSCLIAFRDLKE